MTKYYKSTFYKNDIEVENIKGEILVNITTFSGKKIIYSWYDLIEKKSNSPYINKCLLGGFIKKIPEKVLIIGTGGGSFNRYLEDYIKNIDITGIEIDKAMIDISINEMNIKNKNILNIDALEGIKKLIENKNNNFDLILIDIYDSNSKIPGYVSENLFFKQIKKILNKDGIISINFSDYNENNIFYKKIESSILNNFSNYYYNIPAGKNICGIYNLDKKYNLEEIILLYLQKTKKGYINYDSNLIKKL